MQVNLPCAEIDSQNEPTEKVQSQQSVDPRARRQSVAEHRKPETLVSEGGEPLQFDARRKLDSASRGYPDSV